MNPPDAFAAAVADRYEIDSEIGSGGMGTVYRALDLKHDRPVAVKVVRAGIAASLGRERFVQEIRIAAGLASPHIVPLYDSGDADGTLFYVMPLVEGESLRQLIERDAPLPVDRALEITLDVADGLDHAHRYGFVHRDIKPANILLSGRNALIADFGVARAVENAASGALTATGASLGTPTYMSPEQFSDSGEVDGRADIYSLGCVLYEMLAGRPPFVTSTPVALFAKHAQAEVPPLSDVRDDLPPGLERLVARMLAKDPADRHASAAELIEELRGVRSSAGHRPAPGHTGRRALGALGVVSLAAVLVLVVARGLADGGPGSTGGLDPAALVVLPFGGATTSPEDRSLLIDVADELTRHLNRWDSLRAIPSIALTGALFDLGVEGPVLRTSEDGLRVAERMGAARAVIVAGGVRADEASITTSIFDVASGATVGMPLEADGSASDPHRLAASIVHRLLGLQGPIDEIEELRAHSTDPTAVRVYREGVRALESGRLGAAEAALRTAVARDSTFAMAHHRLAVALYWRAAQDETTLRARSAEIARSSLAAVEYSRGLAARDSLHVLAFYRFQEGDYEAARELYDSLLSTDAADPHAWLMSGIVEFKDPWLSSDRSRPRGDWNKAIRAFTEAVRLSPGFHLGYGHLFDITRHVLRTAEISEALGFEPPRPELLPPWEMLTPHSLVALYPTYRDSVLWMDEAEFGRVDHELVRAGAEHLVERSLGLLRRWAAFAPDEPRPSEELTGWTLRARARLVGTGQVARSDSLTRAALEHARRALTVSADTVPDQLVRIAVLELSLDSTVSADSTLARGVQLRGGDEATRIRRSALNVPLRRGSASEALELLAMTRAASVHVPDPATGELVSDRGAGRLIDRARVLAATGVHPGLVEDELTSIDRLWSDYAPEQVRALRGHYERALAIPLASAPETYRTWRPSLSDPLWDVHDLGASASAARITAADVAPVTEVDLAERTYILAKLARRAGHDGLALSLFERLDSLVYDVENLDVGWALEMLSHLERAEMLAAAGEALQSRRHLDRIVDFWDVSDPLGGAAAERIRAISR